LIEDLFKTVVEASAVNGMALANVGDLADLRSLDAQIGAGGWLTPNERVESLPGVNAHEVVMNKEEKRLVNSSPKYALAGDASLASVRSLTSLRDLNLTGSDVTDAGLAHLEALTNLERLWLDLTRVTPAGFEHLRGLKRLRHVYLPQWFNKMDVNHVQVLLPSCMLHQRAAVDAAHDNPLSRTKM
jgi:hypothetical protein